jgi:hypothetical protein
MSKYFDLGTTIFALFAAFFWFLASGKLPPMLTETVRNLVCGAIVTPMEGAYGNQERHPGRFAGGA